MKFRLTVCSIAILLASTTGEAQWVQTGLSTGEWVVGLAANGSTLFAGLDYGGGVVRSTNNGVNWDTVNNGLGGSTLRALGASGGNIFAGDYGSGVFLSTNNGTNWVTANNGGDCCIRALAISGTLLYAGSNGSGVYVTTNNGTSWTHVNTGPDYPGAVRALAAADSIVIAGSLTGVFRSTNYGTNWTRVNSGLTNTTVYAVGISGTALLAGTAGGGIYRSTNRGALWTPVNSGLNDSSNMTILTFLCDGTRIFAGTNKGVILSTNDGMNWSVVDSGLATKWVNALLVFGSHLYAGTGGGGVWVRPLAEFVTSVETGRGNIAGGFQLEQNYPNPFNPSTTIRYGLPARSPVTLTVFNTLGQSVSTLVNGDMEAGYHEVRFDGSKLASGVYLYRLQAGGFVDTRKLLLIR